MDRAQACEKLARLLDRLGVGSGEGRHMGHRSQNDAGRGAGPKRPASLARGKKGLVGRWINPKHTKVWEVDRSF